MLNGKIIHFWRVGKTLVNLKPLFILKRFTLKQIYLFLSTSFKSTNSLRKSSLCLKLKIEPLLFVLVGFFLIKLEMVFFIENLVKKFVYCFHNFHVVRFNENMLIEKFLVFFWSFDFKIIYLCSTSRWEGGQAAL